MALVEISRKGDIRKLTLFVIEYMDSGGGWGDGGVGGGGGGGK